jgi:superfamily I DNA/RNA helicase
VHIVQWETVEDEAQGLSDYVRFLVDARGYSDGQILVLTPRRVIGYGIRDRLRKAGVSVHSFYHEEALEEEEAQHSFALLSLLASPEDRVALRWWLGHDSSTFRCGPYRRLHEYCTRENRSPWGALSALDDGELQLEGMRNLVSSFHELRERLINLQAYTLEELTNELFPVNLEACSVLREAALLALPQVESVTDLLDSLKIIVTQPEMPEEGDFARVMSLYKSKGLTSNVVIVTDCIQGLIPFVDRDQPAAEQEAILREQRRLFYVALTRCTQILVLSSVVNMDRGFAWKIGASVRGGVGPVARTIASQFLDELGPTAPAAMTGRDWQAANYA